MPLIAFAPLRLTRDFRLKILQFDEIIGLAAQFIRHHGRLRAHGADYGDAQALVLHRLDQAAEIAIAGEQHDMIQNRRHFDHIDGQFDVHIALNFALPGGIGEFLGRLGHHGIAIVIEPIDERANRRIFLILDQGGIVKSADQTAALAKRVQQALIIDIEGE